MGDSSEQISRQNGALRDDELTVEEIWEKAGLKPDEDVDPTEVSAGERAEDEGDLYAKPTEDGQGTTIVDPTAPDYDSDKTS